MIIAMNAGPFSLANKIALVSGSSRGIGRAIAVVFSELGADIVVNGRSSSSLNRVVREIRQRGRRAEALAADVSQSESIDRLVSFAIAKFGRIDILANNAGISPTLKRAVDLSEDEWRRIIDVNLTGTFLLTKAVGKQMIRAGTGTVINIGSIGGQVGLPRLAAYCASKAGVESLTRVCALEWAEHNVRVNGIGPAYVATDMTAGLLSNPRLRTKLLSQTPMNRFARPEEIARVAAFLASDASSYMTGQTVYVDGGWLAE